MRKIAAAAAAIPYIAYVFLQAAVRRLLPGSEADVRDSQVSPMGSKRVDGGPSIRTGAGPVRGSVADPRRIYGDSTPPPMAVPVRQTQVYAEKDLVQSKSQARIADVDRPIPGAPRRPLLGAGVLQVMAVGVAVALLVSALLLGLPAKQVAGGTPASFAPIPPQASSGRSNGDLPLDVAFGLKFTKPMNESSVESAISISPQVGLKFQWDAMGENLALAPDTHWQPFTTYVVVVGNTATDQQGLGISTPLRDSFKSHLAITLMAACTAADGSTSPPLNGTCPPVNGISPAPVCPTTNGVSIPPLTGFCPSQIPLDVVGDDPTDYASQVFTATPKSQLASKSTFLVSFDLGSGSTAATDAAGATLLPIAPLQITTMSAPEVLRFRPQDGSVTYDTNSPISVRFTTAMDTKSTAAAFTVTANGVPVSGGRNWSEGNTVLTLSPRTSFKVGATIVATVKDSARAAGGLHLGGTASATFTVKSRPASKISGGGSATKSSPWHADEVYYMALMNCTRTGGWVTSSGTCSSVTHHTLPAQGKLGLSAGISNNVSRPYAKYMADNRLLSHYLRGTNPHSRMCKAGYCGGSWGENIANGGRGMVAIEIFYQNEYWCRCEHYGNIMNGHFGVAGVGVWASGGAIRVAIDFYS